MSADSMWVEWNNSMNAALIAHDAMQQALEGSDSEKRMAAILVWIATVKVPAKLLDGWRNSTLARFELGESLAYMRDITSDYLRAVFEILGAASLSPRTIEMLAQGAASDDGFTDDTTFLRLIGIKQ